MRYFSLSDSLSPLSVGLWTTQIHDELLWEVEEASLGAVVRVVQHAMEEASLRWNLIVPMPVRLRAGPSWGELMEDFVMEV